MAQVMDLQNAEQSSVSLAAPRLRAALGLSPADGQWLDYCLESNLVSEDLACGAALFRQGDVADALYLLISGRLRAVTQNQDGTETILADFTPGEMIGDEELLTREPRRVTVRAVRDSSLLWLSQSAVESILQRCPRALMQVARHTVGRLRKSPSAHFAHINTICVAPAGEHAPVAEFAAQLAAELDWGSRTLHLDRRRFEDATRGFDEEATLAYLSEQEQRYDYVLYESDATPSAWTQRCFRQADRIVLVADAASDPSLGQVEQIVSSARRELVLAHRDNNRIPAGTDAWLALRSVAMHHHVSLNSGIDIGRVARLVTGRGVGLVLSGGGARAFAHIGVIHALREAGVPIDAIAGTSMGAEIGAQCALGWDSERMIEQNRECWVQNDPLGDYTLPLVALLTGERLTDALQKMFGVLRIEDLRTRFYCASTNLTSGELVQHHVGPLRKYVRASMSIPGLAPPVADGRDLLVDGGILDSQPGLAMRKLLDGGTVIAVNANTHGEPSLSIDCGDGLSAGQLLWSKLRPWQKASHVPNICEILERTAMLNSAGHGDSCDLALHPPTEAFGIDDFDAIEQIAECGYRHAIETLVRWERHA